MPALTQILVPVIRLLSDFKINKFLTNTRITRDHLFINKKPTRHLLLIKLMNGNSPSTEFAFDFIIIYCEILFKKSYLISLHEKRNYQKTKASPMKTFMTEKWKSTIIILVILYENLEFPIYHTCHCKCKKRTFIYYNECVNDKNIRIKSYQSLTFNINKTRIKTEFEITMKTRIYSIISLQFQFKILASL